MKDEYITKAATIAAIGKHQCNYLNNCYEQDCLAIANLPAADVTPVIHGKWINPHWQSSIHCMNCNQCKYEAQHSVYHGVEKYYHYCPNCGAKMDDTKNE